MAISIPIISEFSPKGIDKAIKEFKQLETAGEKAQFAIKKAAVPAAAALGALTAAATLSVKAAMEDQKSQTELARTLGISASATEEQIKQTERMIASYEMAAGVADTELRTAYASLVRGTKDLTQAEQGLEMALNISAATGMDLATVSDALSKAYAGNMRGLRSLSPEMAVMIKEGASLDEVMSVLGGTFGGAFAADAETAEGRMRRFGIAMENAQESIGYALLPAIEAVLPLLTKLGEWANENTKVFLVVGGVIAGLAGSILLANAALKAFAIIKGTVTAAVALFNVVMALNPIGLVVLAIAALIAGLTAAYFKFEGFRKVVDTVFKFIGNAISASLDVVKGYFEFVLGFYKGLFNGIAKLWNNTIGKLEFSIPDWVPIIGGKGFKVPNIPMLAEGGIVTKPTLALIGESGPEAVVPLSRLDRGSPGGSVVNITINSTIADESLPEKLVQALRTYNRTTGPVRIQVL
jgi:predicted DNA-binding protein YlxM (UPF0122 family)